MWLHQPTETSTCNTLKNIAQKYVKINSNRRTPLKCHAISNMLQNQPAPNSQNPPTYQPTKPAQSNQTKQTCWKDQGEDAGRRLKITVKR